MAWLDEFDVEELESPAQSSDLSPIGHIQDDLKRTSARPPDLTAV